MSTSEETIVKCPDGDCDMEYQEETVGDSDVINGTMTTGLWECTLCGHTKEGSPPDDSYLDNLSMDD